MYENSHKIGSMGGGESPSMEAIPPQAPIAQPEPTGDEIHILFVEMPEKSSAPPPYKPDKISP